MGTAAPHSCSQRNSAAITTAIGGRVNAVDGHFVTRTQRITAQMH
jgi:hypothetical protein